MEDPLIFAANNGAGLFSYPQHQSQQPQQRKPPPNKSCNQGGLYYYPASVQQQQHIDTLTAGVDTTPPHRSCDPSCSGFSSDCQSHSRHSHRATQNQNHTYSSNCTPNQTHLPYPPSVVGTQSSDPPSPKSRDTNHHQHGRPLGGRASSTTQTASHSNQPKSTVSLGLGLETPVAASEAARTHNTTAESVVVTSVKSPNKRTGSGTGSGITTSAAYIQSASTPAAPAPALIHPRTPPVFNQPFRSLAPKSSKRTLRQPSARLWNPTNSTPRLHPCHQPQQQQHLRRNRRPSTPPPPSFPLQHPALDSSVDVSDPDFVGSGDYPLLTLPQLRQIRLSQSPTDGGHIDRRGGNDRRVSIPSSVRASYDGKNSQGHTPPSLQGEITTITSNYDDRNYDVGLTIVKQEGRSSFIMATDIQQTPRPRSLDLERGPDVSNIRHSTASLDGIGSAISSSDSSIMGEEVDPNEEEWGPQHPCFPHMNSHVPVTSREYSTTRIIRIKRDWMIQGDLAPTFSNLYPEILDPAGLSEQEFRRIIEKINGELIPTFNPLGLRNIVDGVLGVATGWLWDDLGLTAAKSRLNKLEKWIEDWNRDMEKAAKSEMSGIPPRLISLRRTGYMSLDIQISDPEIAAAPSHASGAGDSRVALGLEPVTTNA